jgi:hypothetical protein
MEVGVILKGSSIRAKIAMLRKLDEVIHHHLTDFVTLRYPNTEVILRCKKLQY